jgi:molecular chaperone GrpE
MIDEQKQQENTLENSTATDNNELSFTAENSDSELTGEGEMNPETLTADDNNDVTAASDVESTTDFSELLAENEAIIATFQQENGNLKKLLDEQTEQTNIAKAQYARLAADFDNFRKRTSKEKESLEQFAKKDIITDLLPVIDNFERARTQLKPETEGEKAIHGSYQGVYKNLVDALKRMGVSAMRPEGEQFDPNFHEAMLREATNEHPEGTVLEQLVRGYLLGDLVIRHAMVKVAVPQETTSSNEEEALEREQVDNQEEES